MSERQKTTQLTGDEKSIVKALLNQKWRNQDIHVLMNTGREKNINGGRITEIKQNNSISAATDDQVDYFKIKKRSYDPQTRLNLFDDERLIRSREAMILAVQSFNSPAVRFKTEVFTMLAIVAWTYLLHEYYERKGSKILNKKRKSLSLSQMLLRTDCPLSKGIKKNLQDIKILRDEVEHSLLGRGDIKWLDLFQSCCLNFDKTICVFLENPSPCRVTCLSPFSFQR